MILILCIEANIDMLIYFQCDWHDKHICWQGPQYQCMVKYILIDKGQQELRASDYHHPTITIMNNIVTVKNIIVCITGDCGGGGGGFAFTFAERMFIIIINVEHYL